MRTLSFLIKYIWTWKGSLVEPGRIKSSSKGNTLEDLAEDKEGESRLEEEEEVFDENEEAVKAPSQLGEDQDAYGRQVLSLSYPCEAKSLSSSMLILPGRFSAASVTGLQRKVQRA